MLANAKRPSFKGHCAVCASRDGQIRGQGWSERLRPSEQRDFGRPRRVRRSEIPEDQLPGYDSGMELDELVSRLKNLVDEVNEDAESVYRLDVRSMERLHKSAGQLLDFCQEFDDELAREHRGG